MSFKMLAREENRLESVDRDLEEAELALLRLEQEIKSCRTSLLSSSQDGLDFAATMWAADEDRRHRSPQRRRDRSQDKRLLGGMAAAAATSANTKDSSATSYKVRIRLQRRDERLGLALQQEGTSVVVLDIRPNSAFGRWNASHRTRQDGQMIQIGDVVVSVNGLIATTPQDVWEAAIPEVQLHFNFERRQVSEVFLAGSASVSSFSSTDVEQEPALTLPGDMLPGRHSCAQPGVLPKARRQGGTRRPEPTQSHPQASTFGCAERFKARAGVGGQQSAPDLLDNAISDAYRTVSAPSDRFLSTRPRCPSAVMPPLPKSRGNLEDETRDWLMKVCSSMGVGFTSGKSLRGLHTSMVALLQEEMLREELRHRKGVHSEGEQDDDYDDDDVSSTEFGSDFEQEASVASSFLSMLSSRSRGTPGPGSYNVDHSLTESHRAGPSFGVSSRHLSTPDRKRKGDDGVDEMEVHEGRDRSRSRDRPLTTKGGKINPPHQHQPKLPTERMRDEIVAASRDLSVADWGGVGQSVPAVDFASAPSVGRLDPVQETEEPGPGSYVLQPIPIPGLGAVIHPEPIRELTTTEAGPQSKADPLPGPGAYEVAAASQWVYPSSSNAADFNRFTPHFARDQVPAYIAEQEDLDPQWDVVLRRSLSCVIPPEPKRRSRRPWQVPGPGTYMQQNNWLDNNHAIVRLRDGRMIVRWMPLARGKSEHDHGLYRERPIDPSIRGDPRPLLGGDTFDAALRRRHRQAIFLPEGKITQRRRRCRSWDAADGINYPFPEEEDATWRMADPQLAPEPECVGSFARRLAFEDFARHEARWAYLEKRAQKRDHPSRKLAYSLPSLDVTKEKAPRPPDLSKQRARSLDGDDSDLDGDVLHLSLSRERDLMHQRAPYVVDMNKMRGRTESAPPDIGEDEELILSPRPVLRRGISPVNMDHMLGRPDDPDFSANLWAEHGGVVYIYHPAQGVRGEESESLLLDTSPSRRRRPQGGDFFRPLGRLGIDPRAPSGPNTNGIESDEIEELFLEIIRANDLRRRTTEGADFGRPLGRPDVDPRVRGSMPNRPVGAEDLLLNWDMPFERPRPAAPVPLPTPASGTEEEESAPLPLPVPAPYIPPVLPPPVLPPAEPESIGPIASEEQPHTAIPQPHRELPVERSPDSPVPPTELP